MYKIPPGGGGGGGGGGSIASSRPNWQDRQARQVSDQYTHLTYYCVCHLENASQLFFKSIQFPFISGSHVFSHNASGHDIIKSHCVTFFNEISVIFFLTMHIKISLKFYCLLKF